MSFERLPLALTISLTLTGGAIFFNTTSSLANPWLQGSTASSAYNPQGNRSILVAVKDSNDVSADSPTTADKSAGKKSKAAAKEEKGRLFHRHNATEEKAKVEEKTKAKEQAKKEITADEKKAPAEAKDNLVFIPDDALISVLRDINRALADSQNDQVQKIENTNEKQILSMAQEIFAKALAEPSLPANRIVPKGAEKQAKSSLTAESWSSGDVVVNDKLRGSMASVWAKRIGGLLTVTIAGDAGDSKTADGIPIGEFMVVVTAHSPVQSGFDIQSQGDVTFWMGKLNNIMVEANCVPSDGTDGENDKSNTTSSANNASSPSGSEAKKKSIISLSPLLTNRYRKHYEILLAADKKSQRAAAQLVKAADPEEGENGPASGDERKSSITGETATQDRTAGDAELKTDDKTARGDKSDTASRDKAARSASENNQIALASSTGVAATGTNTAAAVVDAGSRFHLPSANATLLMPDRALAGQYVTVGLLSRDRLPETNVELSFNGVSLATDISGQAVYQIPDDTTPGRSLNIALSARPDEVPATVEVLQPLNVTTGQAPKLDRMTPLAIKGSVLTIDGHNFDGIAQNNSVLVDGSLEGHIVSASPFQLKVILPAGLRPGPHSLCVSTDSMRSNLAGFDYADTVIIVEGKDSGKENSSVKLLVKVLGTTAKMNVKILNQTPDVIRLNRGAELTVTSSGGFDNTVQLPAVRVKKGTFKIDTQIEI